MNESCHTYEWVVSYIWMSHVTHVNEDNSPQSHTWMSHVARMNESCHTHEWVMSHAWISHATPHTWMIHVTHMNESCHTCEWVISHIVTSHMWTQRGLSPQSEFVTHLQYQCVTHLHVNAERSFASARSLIVIPASEKASRSGKVRERHINGTWHIWMGHGTYEWVMTHMNES